MEAIQTVEFVVSRGRLLRSALKMGWGIGATIGVAAVFVAGVTCGLLIDLRWLLVAWMVLLVAAPGVMAMLYLNYAFSPRCLPEVYRHTVRFTDAGIEVRAIVPPLPVAEEEEERDNSAQESKIIGYEASYQDVCKVKPGLKGLVIELRGTPPGLLHLPYEVLPDPVRDTAIIIEKCRGTKR